MNSWDDVVAFLGSPRIMHRRIAEIDTDAFVFDVKPMTQLIAESLADTPVLDHTAVGIRSRRPRSFARGYLRRYPHSVAQRTVEIGIRIAMGASPARVTGLMLRYGLLPVLCGMAFGWSGAFAISRFFSALLFDVGPLDLPTWILVSGSMLAVECIASDLPARRECSVDPTVALRAE